MAIVEVRIHLIFYQFLMAKHNMNTKTAGSDSWKFTKILIFSQCVLSSKFLNINLNLNLIRLRLQSRSGFFKFFRYGKVLFLYFKSTLLVLFLMIITFFTIFTILLVNGKLFNILIIMS